MSTIRAKDGKLRTSTHIRGRAHPVYGVASDTTVRTFNQQSYVVYPNLTVTLTIIEPCAFLVWGKVCGSGSAARATCWAMAAYLDGVQVAPLTIQGQPSGSPWQSSGVMAVTALQSPGTYTIDLRVYVYTAGDTVTMRYSSLAVMAMPVV